MRNILRVSFDIGQVSLQLFHCAGEHTFVQIYLRPGFAIKICSYHATLTPHHVRKIQMFCQYESQLHMCDAGEVCSGDCF